MQETRCASRSEVLGWIVRVVMGVALIMLTAGVWACLWVPPSF